MYAELPANPAVAIGAAVSRRPPERLESYFTAKHARRHAAPDIAVESRGGPCLLPDPVLTQAADIRPSQMVARVAARPPARTGKTLTFMPSRRASDASHDTSFGVKNARGGFPSMRKQRPAALWHAGGGGRRGGRGGSRPAADDDGWASSAYSSEAGSGEPSCGFVSPLSATGTQAHPPWLSHDHSSQGQRGPVSSQHRGGPSRSSQGPMMPTECVRPLFNVDTRPPRNLSSECRVSLVVVSVFWRQLHERSVL